MIRAARATSRRLPKPKGTWSWTPGSKTRVSDCESKNSAGRRRQMAGTWDLVIRNTTIYDGTGAEPTIGDVAVNGDRIAAVGDVSGEGVQELDARNHALAPGFIDVHSHDDFAVFLTP